MTAGVLGLFASVAFVVLLLVGIGFRTDLDWKCKAAVTLAAAGVLIGCYFSLIALLGWPTPFHGGERDWGLIHAAVREPDKRGGDEGGIFLWVRSDTGDGTPRALRFDYRRDLHDTVVAALSRQAGGVRQGVRTQGGAQGAGGGGSFSMHDLHKPKPADKDRY